MSATPGTSFPDPKKYGFAGRMASLFIDSKLTPIIVAASLLLGLFSILVLPREEEPQIKVPMIDVMVAMPGASAREVESRVSARSKSSCGRSPASSISIPPPCRAPISPLCASRSGRISRKAW